MSSSAAAAAVLSFLYLEKDSKNVNIAETVILYKDSWCRAYTLMPCVARPTHTREYFVRRINRFWLSVCRRQAIVNKRSHKLANHRQTMAANKSILNKWKMDLKLYSLCFPFRHTKCLLRIVPFHLYWSTSSRNCAIDGRCLLKFPIFIINSNFFFRSQYVRITNEAFTIQFVWIFVVIHCIQLFWGSIEKLIWNGYYDRNRIASDLMRI